MSQTKISDETKQPQPNLPTDNERETAATCVLDRESETTSPASRRYDKLDRHFDIFVWLERSILPVPLFISVVLAFAACCYLGYATTGHDQFKGFQHFHPGMGPQTQFYPTLAELISFVEARAKPDQTVVIVGGNSIFNGVGQPPWKMFSQDLQNELGSKFAVVNLSFQGASPFSFAYLAFEAIAKKRHHCLYVTNTIRPGHFDGYFVHPYRYAFYDGRQRGLLIDDAEREAFLQETESHLARKHSQELNELKLRMNLEKQFYFCDLWNSVGFRKFFTVWDWLAARNMNPFDARKHYPDLPMPIAPVQRRFDNVEYHTQIIRDAMKGLLDGDGKGGFKESPVFWRQFARHTAVTVPKKIRSQVLVVSTYDCPFYLSKLSESEQRENRLAYETAARRWSEQGYNNMIVGQDFTNEDYADRNHLTMSGAQKMSEQIAGKIETMVKEQHSD